MSRKPNIKWRESDTEIVNKVAKKFNAKIYRERKKHPENISVLPDTIKKEDKQKMIAELKNAPRSEFKKKINSLERFNKKGAEQVITSKTGNKATKWEKNEIGLEVAQINRNRTRERKRIEEKEVTSQGVPTGLKRGEMGSVRMNELKPKVYDFDKIKGGKAWEKFKETVHSQSSINKQQELMDEYKANYLASLTKNFGGYEEKIYNLVQGLPSELVMETYYTEQQASIKFHYDPKDMQIILDNIEEIWQKVSDTYYEEINR